MMYNFELTGRMPLLVHADDVEAADKLKIWRKDKNNKSESVAGDDRSPAWTWQTYLYHDDEFLAIPQQNIMKCLGKAASRVPKREGRGTYKEISQSGMMIPSEFCEFYTGGRQISIKAIHQMSGLTFAEQAKAVQKLGFDLLVKRASIGASKHVRVRARFKTWTIKGTLDAYDPALTHEVLKDMFEEAGSRVGLLDWRPSSPKSPGPFGTFTFTLAPMSDASAARRRA